MRGFHLAGMKHVDPGKGVPMDAVSLCESQQREIMDQIAAVAAAPSVEVAASVSRLTHVVLAHLATEEQLLFPALRSDRTAAALAQALDEHAGLRRATENLRRAGLQTASFSTYIQELRDRAATHFSREDRDLLMHAASDLDAEVRQQLGSLMGERYLTLRGVEIHFVDVRASVEQEAPQGATARRRDP